MNGVQIVEVGPRDGFQSVGPIIPTARKIDLIAGLHAAGLRRMEVTSFVSESAVPQMADAAEVLAAARALPSLDAQVLVPTVRHAERALAAGADHLSFVLSVSAAHNQSNVKRSPAESALDYARILALAPRDTRIRLNLATAFDCPYDGRVAKAATLDLLETLLTDRTDLEVALCDTTGRVTPGHVRDLFEQAIARFPAAIRWAYHGHDTFGMGAANVLAAWNAGVRVIDASVAGLGGCPFAPGATGNLATEDLIYMFDGMGVRTGIDLDALLAVAREVCAIDGAQVGGRVRDAVSARQPCGSRAEALA